MREGRLQLRMGPHIRSSYAGLTRVGTRRSRLLLQFAIVDIADRDRPPGQRAAQPVGQLMKVLSAAERMLSLGCLEQYWDRALVL